MFQKVLTSIFGSRNQRLLKEYGRAVEKINALEAELSALSDDGLRAKTVEFRERIGTGTAAGKELAQILDDLLPEAFAVCREAAKRALGMRHFDVQLVGGMVLHTARSRRCAPARARRSPPRCRST